MTDAMMKPVGLTNEQPRQKIKIRGVGDDHIDHQGPEMGRLEAFNECDRGRGAILFLARS